MDTKSLLKKLFGVDMAFALWKKVLRRVKEWSQVLARMKSDGSNFKKCAAYMRVSTEKQRVASDEQMAAKNIAESERPAGMVSCHHCGEAIKDNDGRVVIHKDDHFEIIVHEGCFDKYDTEYLSGEAVRRRGRILGLCSVCEAPVREKDRYRLGRDCNLNEEAEDEAKEKLLTTIPNGFKAPHGDHLFFVHCECS